MNRLRTAVLLVAVFGLAPTAPAPAATIPRSVPFEQIERGDASGFRYSLPGFTGAELHITDRRSWAEFWRLHTRSISPSPQLPEVNFPEQNVIVLLLGAQTSGGGPSIGVQQIVRTDRGSRIEVLEDRTPGPLAAITNPYQIIVTPNLGRSVAFVHTEPGERLCQTQADCPTDYTCSLVDPTCRSPVTGRCVHRPPGSACPTVFIPVCGCDGITYSNTCFLELAGAVLAHLGECP